MARAVAFRWVLSRISALFIVASLLWGCCDTADDYWRHCQRRAVPFIVPSPWNGNW